MMRLDIASPNPVPPFFLVIVIGPIEWSKLNVSLELVAVLAWPAEHFQFAQPATRRMPHEHFGCRWFVAEGGVWPHCVVVAPPALDDDLGLAQRVEDFTVEQLVAKASIALAPGLKPHKSRHELKNYPHTGLGGDSGKRSRSRSPTKK
jgi:hypothetical protein